METIIPLEAYFFFFPFEGDFPCGNDILAGFEAFLAQAFSPQQFVRKTFGKAGFGDITDDDLHIWEEVEEPCNRRTRLTPRGRVFQQVAGGNPYQRL
jgi:hypothetical protein